MKSKAFDNTSSKLLYKKSCPLSGKDAPTVDYKNIHILKNTSRKGKILPSRVTQVSTKTKRTYLAIKRARFSALLPYVSN